MLTNMSGVSLHGRRDDEETDSSHDASKIRICSSNMLPTQKEAHTKDQNNPESSIKVVPSLADLTYQESLENLGLPPPKERRERGDMIAVFRVMKRIDKIDREDLFVWDGKATRGH